MPGQGCVSAPTGMSVGVTRAATSMANVRRELGCAPVIASGEERDGNQFHSEYRELVFQKSADYAATTDLHVGIAREIMITATRLHDVGMLIRVIVAWIAWLTMVFADISFFISVCIVITTPILLGGVIWHLRSSRSVSSINRLSFCAAIAFFPLFAIQWILATR